MKTAPGSRTVTCPLYSGSGARAAVEQSDRAMVLRCGVCAWLEEILAAMIPDGATALLQRGAQQLSLFMCLCCWLPQWQKLLVSSVEQAAGVHNKHYGSSTMKAVGSVAYFHP